MASSRLSKIALPLLDTTTWSSSAGCRSCAAERVTQRAWQQAAACRAQAENWVEVFGMPRVWQASAALRSPSVQCIARLPIPLGVRNRDTRNAGNSHPDHTITLMPTTDAVLPVFAPFSSPNVGIDAALKLLSGQPGQWGFRICRHRRTAAGTCWRIWERPRRWVSGYVAAAAVACRRYSALQSRHRSTSALDVAMVLLKSRSRFYMPTIEVGRVQEIARSVISGSPVPYRPRRKANYPL